MKRMAALILAVMCAFVTIVGGGFSVYAETTTEMTTSTTDDMVEATNLLTSFYVYGTAETNKLYLSGYVKAIETMAKLGFKDFVVQRRATSTGNWTDTNYSVSDQLGSNVVAHTFDQYPLSVAGGYYYRVCANAYAKETGWFFPKSQTLQCFSGSVWVPAT